MLESKDVNPNQEQFELIKRCLGLIYKINISDACPQTSENYNQIWLSPLFIIFGKHVPQTQQFVVCKDKSFTYPCPLKKSVRFTTNLQF